MRARGPCHYGTIASGNLVVLDVYDRDYISNVLGGALCFETEAAGLMNNFLSLMLLLIVVQHILSLETSSVGNGDKRNRSWSSGWDTLSTSQPSWSWLASSSCVARLARSKHWRSPSFLCLYSCLIVSHSSSTDWSSDKVQVSCSFSSLPTTSSALTLVDVLEESDSI
jgi:hypothetical protein